MSARLIGHMDGPHDLKDDLKSSLYILLWMALMFSKCSNTEQVPSFLSGVLDPQPNGSTGGYGKADFLKGKTFLAQVKFPGRPAFDTLLYKLAELFAVHYEEPPLDSQRSIANTLLSLAQNDPMTLPLYKSSTAYLFEQRMTALKSHGATIAIFDAALLDRSQWPADDQAEDQHIRTKTSSPDLVMKTGWNTSLIIQEIEGSWDEQAEESDSDEADLSQMIDIETSSEKSDSDELTVSGFGPIHADEDLGS